jgi:hypothetical protein
MLITSLWELPLKSSDGSFQIKGSLSPFNGQKLNPVIEPLGMGSIKSGNISAMNFAMKGNDYKAEGEETMIYDNLKIKLLKAADDNSLKNKTITNFFANIIIKDQNPSGGKTRKGDMAFDRVMTKSFFNLVWKSIFAGAKKSIR